MSLRRFEAGSLDCIVIILSSPFRTGTIMTGLARPLFSRNKLTSRTKASLCDGGINSLGSENRV